MLVRIERIDSQLAEYNERNPNQITAEVATGFCADKPLAQRDQGKEFVEFALERLSSDYSQNRIGQSRYENGKSCMNIFQTFLRATKQSSYRPDAIYVGNMTPELLDSYISWRREIKQNSDATINHSLTPILKACAYACEMGMMEPAVNARIQELVLNLARYENFNVEYTASILLSAVVTAIGNSCRIRIKGEWKTSPSIYMMLVGRPGLGKTPPLGFLYKPIREHDDRMYEKYNEEWNAYERALASSGNRRGGEVEDLYAAPEAAAGNNRHLVLHARGDDEHPPAQFARHCAGGR